MRTELTYARIALPFAYAPIFRNLQKGERKKTRLNVTYRVDKAIFRFIGTEPLDATDLRVLQGLTALATANFHNTKNIVDDAHAQRKNLSLKGDALEAETIAVRFHLTYFVRNIGYAKCGTALNHVRESILRLSGVTVFVDRPGFVGSFHMVGGAVLDKKTGQIVVGLNPILAAAVLGHTNYVYADMQEIRALKSDAARLLHARLGWINAGGERPVTLVRLRDYVYPPSDNGEPLNSSTLRTRNLAIKRAVGELRKIGWNVVPEAGSKGYKIKRPVR